MPLDFRVKYAPLHLALARFATISDAEIIMPIARWLRISLCGFSFVLAGLGLAGLTWGLAAAAFTPPPPGGTVRLNVADPGRSDDVAISDNGRYVAFDSSSDVMFSGDSNATFDVFRRDLTNNTTALVSARNGTSATFGD